MRKSSPFVLRVASFVLAMAGFAWSQATINESLETASVYVDAVNGSDATGTGSVASPYQTINKGVSVAVANNWAGIGTQVNIQPGTYRETVSMTKSVRDTSLPMTFQAVTSGTAIVNGATILTGWTEDSRNRNVYTTAWTYNFPACAQIAGCPAAQSIVLQNEMLAVNGSVMTQVLSYKALQPGSFYVDQTNGLIHLYPPSDADVATATIETATEPSLWTLSNKSNIVLRGLTFQYANSCRSNPAVSVGGAGSNVLLDSLTIQWNNGQGLSINNPFTNFTVQNTISKHNGDGGFQEFQTLNGLWTNDNASFNNWRGAQGGYYACNTGGGHPYQSHNDTINGMTYAYNQTYGVHWDVDNANITASNIVSTNNLIGAVFSEKNEGPIAISESHLCNGNALVGAGGLAIRNSTNVSFTNSTTYNNPPAEVIVFGQPGGITITNWQTGQQINLVTSNFTNTGNVFESVGTSDYVFENATLGGSDWSTFTSNFVSSENTWWDASNTTSPFVTPAPVFDTKLDLSGWQSALAQDLSSRFAAPPTDPSASCKAVVPDMPDYWLNIDNTALTLNALGQATFNLTATPLDFSGTVSLMVDGVQKLRGMSSAFGASSISLANGASATSALTFTGLINAPPGIYPITVVANSGNLTRMVTAQLTIPARGFRLSTLALAFPSQQVNLSAAPLTVTLTNYGRSSTAITSILSSATAFAQTNTCGTSLAANASCTVTVTFTPNFVGNYTATLTLNDADPSGPQLITLTGTGTAAPTATLSPANMSFGSVTVGTTSTSKTSTLTDTSSTVELNLASLALSGTNPADFTVTPSTTCPNSGSLAPLANCQVTVSFTPQATGSRSATLTITDNTHTGQQTITLNGSGK